MNRTTGRRAWMTLGLPAWVLVAYQFPLSTDRPAVLAGVFLATWLLCLVALAERGHGGIYRPSAMYMLIFGLFHGGLLLSVALRGPDGLEAYDESWLYDPWTPTAVRLVLLGMVSFTVAAHLVAGRPERPVTAQPADPATRRRLGAIGLVIELAGLLIFVAAVVAAGGMRLVTGGGYLTYIEVNSANKSLAYGTLMVGLGATCGVVAGGRARFWTWMVFASYAAVAFPIGNRGAVLFPLAALLVAEARCGRRPRPKPALLGTVLVLVAIGIVRQARLTGYTMPTPSRLLAAPLDAIAEMGTSLLPTVVVLDWHASGDPFRNGSTLVAVPLRVFEGLTGWGGGRPVYDDRLFNVEIAERVGPIGGSPVAEGYHNLGLLGVVLLLAAIGMLVGWLDRSTVTLAGDVQLVLLAPLLIQVRNSFAPVPVSLAFGLALVVFVHVWSNSSTRGGHHASRAGKEPAAVSV